MGSELIFVPWSFNAMRLFISCSHAGGFVTSLPLSLKQIRKLIGKRGDPFYEAQENHNLIGVANVFLECLFYDVKLQYAVPIISQQGEVELGWAPWVLLRGSSCISKQMVPAAALFPS